MRAPFSIPNCNLKEQEHFSKIDVLCKDNKGGDTKHSGNGLTNRGLRNFSEPISRGTRNILAKFRKNGNTKHFNASRKVEVTKHF